ncbi:MAG TPA: aromatic ring-hydroxylating dioxygenase subunit alpha [Rhodothermales bacterium]|nr:aromatic ring-hydroxylating dioxygenase subunit alpha [Rhodothermales bacterium]
MTPPAAPPLDLLPPESLAVRPLAQAETIPSAWYTDPRVHAFERGAVFARTWQYAAHVSQLDRPGSYVTAEAAGESLILVRGRDGTVRAFYNVCRHRGGPLAMDACGHARMLQCKYHGWTYTLDGILRGVPRFDRTELFDKADYGLVPVEVAEWEGLLFVRLEGGEGPGLEEALAGIRERIAPQRLGALRFHRRDTYDVACNWKAYVDNYLEGYHIPLVHPELCRVLDYRAYVTETFPRYSLQHSPLRDDDGRYGDGDAFYYFVFPNTMLNVLPGRLQVNTVLPLAADRCRVVFDYCYLDPEAPGTAERIAADVAFSDLVQQEDVEICEHVQRGLASRGYDLGRFSPECEEGVYHFQTLVKEAYRGMLGE